MEIDALRLVVSELHERNDLQIFYLPQEWHELFDAWISAIDYLASDGRAGIRQEAANLL